MVVHKTPVAKAPARAAATKAAVAKTAAARKPKVEETAPDLLAGMEEADPVSEEELDLLDGLTESNGTSWMPWEEDDQPIGVQGIVKFLGTIGSDYGDEDVPLMEVQDAKDADLLWSIRGYSTVLRNQITKADPQVGDFFAVKYLGEITGKKGKPYHNFKAAVRHL